MATSGTEITKTLYTPEEIARTADFWEVGFDPGSGFCIVYGTPVKTRMEGRREIQERGTTYTLMLPSLVGNISLDELAAGRGLIEGAQIRSVLEPDEYIIRRSDGKTDKVVGKWAEIEGKNYTAAKGLAQRYWGEHSLDLALASITILATNVARTPRIQVRLVTGLPWSLFEVPGNRKLVSNNLEGTHHYKFNGGEYEMTILVGAVIAEGYAPIAYAEEIDGDQLSIDIGERTINAIYAHNLTILYDRCRSEMYGIGNINDAIIQHIRREYRKVLKLSEVRDYLMLYTAGKYMPPLKTHGKTLEDADLKAIYGEHINTEWLSIQTMLGSMLNVEGAEVASNIQRLLLSGGGAAVYERKFQKYLPGTSVIVTPSSQDRNAEYYHDVARTIEQSKPDVWKR